MYEKHFMFSRVRQSLQNRRTCAKILAFVKYVGKYQKAHIRRHTFYLVIFQTIGPKIVLIQIQ